MTYSVKHNKKAGETVISCSDWQRPRVFKTGSDLLKEERESLRKAGHIQLCPPRKAWRF